LRASHSVASARAQQRRIEAEIANEQRRLESERDQQQLENERTRAELEAIREQVAVPGVDGYIAMQQNEALREAVSSGNANVYVVRQGSPLNLPQ
jgi:multidrug resistance efflux pump